MSIGHIFALPYTNLLPQAKKAIQDSFKERGFTSNMILEDYVFSGQDGREIKANMLAFTQPRYRLGYSGVSVYNATNGIETPSLIFLLAQSAAPLHLIHHQQDEEISFWLSEFTDQAQNPIKAIPIQKNISYSNLNRVLADYAIDFNPTKILKVKQGEAVFQKISQNNALQLALWAVEVTGKKLVEHFGSVVNHLREYRHPITAKPINEQTVTQLAIQLLAATILADAGDLGHNLRQRRSSLALDGLIATANKQFPNYFEPKLIKKWSNPANEAYKLLSQLNYAGFTLEMLTDLYREAYPNKKTRQALGRYDTPLYLTRRIWQNIPVEFLHPQERVTLDMTCGWGSFLVAGYERLSQLIDMEGYPLRDYLYGNDKDPFTAQLAGMALLIASGKDSWHISNYNALNWPPKPNPNIIVGNPPFKRLSKTKELANQFLVRALNYLAEGGYIAFIIPRSFVDGEASPQLRKQLLELCDVLEIWEVPNQTFVGATVRPLIILAQKKSKLSLSHHPVIARTLQPFYLDNFKVTGEFTKSSLVPTQSSWNELNNRAKNNTHIITYNTILSSSNWQQIQANTHHLQTVADVFQGLNKGQNPNNKRNKDDASKEVLFITGGKTSIKQSFYLVYRKLTCSYPSDFTRPRLDKKELIEKEKILLTRLQDATWGKRVKVAIERQSYYPSDSFVIVVPIMQTYNPHLTIEAIAAILDWKVSNAWAIERLKQTSLSLDYLRATPVPYLNEKMCQALTLAVQNIEKAYQNNLSPAAKDFKTIDDTLKVAYNLDEEIYHRLSLVYNWDKNPQLTLDTQPDSNVNWEVSGVVERVDAINGTLDLWLNNFPEMQTVPISPVMPGWLLRPETYFRTTIPSTCAINRSLNNVRWGKFFPQDYSYFDEMELLESLTEILTSTKNRDDYVTTY